MALSPELAGSAAATDTVFVFARAVDGPPMPVALARLSVADLPARVTLDDRSSMTPAARLSGTEQVVVGARVSRTGQAMPSSGDLQGVLTAIAPGRATIRNIKRSKNVPRNRNRRKH